MANPQVDLMTESVKWTDPPNNTDGTPISPGEITGYLVGIRSTTVAGSVAGTYAHTGLAAATATSLPIVTVMPNPSKDTYAAAVQAVTANGNSAWSNEYIFDGVLPVPLAPSGVSVG